MLICIPTGMIRKQGHYLHHGSQPGSSFFRVTGHLPAAPGIYLRLTMRAAALEKSFFIVLVFDDFKYFLPSCYYWSLSENNPTVSDSSPSILKASGQNFHLSYCSGLCTYDSHHYTVAGMTRLKYHIPWLTTIDRLHGSSKKERWYRNDILR